MNVPDEMARRGMDWNPGFLPPTHLRNYVHKFSESSFVFAGPETQKLQTDDAAMRVEAAVISTYDADRVGDKMRPSGAYLDNYAKNAVVLAFHDQTVPVGIAKRLDGSLAVSINPKKDIRSACFFSQATQAGTDIYALVKDGVLSATSIRFDPMERPVQLQAEPGQMYAGYEYTKWDLLEWSWVGIPCNPYCERIREHLERGKIIHGSGKTIEEGVRKYLEPLAAPLKAWSPGWTAESDGKTVSNPVVGYEIRPYDPMRWNRQSSKAFEIESAEFPPSAVFYELVKKFTGCEIKSLYQTETFIPHVRLGSFLTGLDVALKECVRKDVRNLTHGGNEKPPVYDSIRLNSKKSAEFLIEGTSFHEAADGGRFVLNFEPSWSGLAITAWVPQKGKDFVQGLFASARQWAKENNFLKGEAFSLSGEFLDRTSESWDDVFLEQVNKDSLKRVTNLLNEKGGDIANRGVIFLGPPGTGKTLSGRIIRNQAKATFIWVSSRDFHYAGSVGGVSEGFALAKELAPSVLFFEDVDNWLYDTTVDLLKTEMDGISRSKGVLTVLTTNFPELMPEALIDRPGRFHDVLRFGLPSEKARREMLAKWLAGYPQEAVEKAVKGTAGYSGAHVYELASFAKTLVESDSLGKDQAVSQALQKVSEQRDLITSVQLQGSRYRPRKGVGTMSKKYGKTTPVPARRDSEVTNVNSVESVITVWRSALAEHVKESGESSGVQGGYTVPESSDGLEECVSGKIPKLIDEGYAQEQAVAIAYSMCRDKLDKTIPRGAAYAKLLLNQVEGMIQHLEPEVARDFQKFSDNLRAWGHQRYPTLKFVEKSAETPAPVPEPVDPELAEWEALKSALREGVEKFEQRAESNEAALKRVTG